MTGQQQRFSGLRALASKLGMSASTTALSSNGAGSGDENDEDREDEQQRGDEDVQSGADGADGEASGDDGDAAAGEGDEETDDDEEDAGGQPGGGASDAGDAGESEGQGTSAEFQRGHTAGVNATNGRWAATLLSDDCRGNIELATDLLADTSMTPDQIAAYCKRNPGASSASNGMQRLATTPKPRVGLEGGGKDGAPIGDKHEAAEARHAAAGTVNRTTRARAKAAGVQTRKAGGPGGSGKIKDLGEDAGK